MFVDPRLLDEGVQDVKDAVRTPHLARIAEPLQLLVGFRFGFGAPDAERLELVDKLVDDVPQPLFGQFQCDGTVGV